MRISLSTLSLLPLFLFFFKSSSALTNSFDDLNPLIIYTPSSTWSILTRKDLFDNTAHSTNQSGSISQFSFKGAQVTILGTTTANDVSITLDGITQDSSVQVKDTIFKISSLDPGLVHTLIIENNKDDDELVIDQIKVSYPSENGLIPSLVTSPSKLSPSPITFIATISSNTPSTSSVVLSSSSTDSSSSNQAGKIAGAVIGTLVGLLLLAFGIYYFIARRRDKSSHYSDSETGKSDIITSIGASGGNVAERVSTELARSKSRVSKELHRSKSGNTKIGNVEMEEAGGGGIKNSWGRLIETGKFYGLKNKSLSQDSDQVISESLAKVKNFPTSTIATRIFEDSPLPDLPLFTTSPQNNRASYPSCGDDSPSLSPLSFPSTLSPQKVNIESPSSTPSSFSRLSAISLPTRSFHIPTAFVSDSTVNKSIQEGEEELPTVLKKEELSSSPRDEFSNKRSRSNRSINSLRSSVLNWDVSWVTKPSKEGIETEGESEGIDEKKLTKPKNRRYTSQDDYYGHSFTVGDRDREIGDIEREIMERNSLEDRY